MKTSQYDEIEIRGNGICDRRRYPPGNQLSETSLSLDIKTGIYVRSFITSHAANAKSFVSPRIEASKDRRKSSATFVYVTQTALEWRNLKFIPSLTGALQVASLQLL